MSLQLGYKRAYIPDTTIQGNISEETHNVIHFFMFLFLGVPNLERLSITFELPNLQCLMIIHEYGHHGSYAWMYSFPTCVLFDRKRERFVTSPLKMIFLDIFGLSNHRLWWVYLKPHLWFTVSQQKKGILPKLSILIWLSIVNLPAAFGTNGTNWSMDTKKTE